MGFFTALREDVYPKGPFAGFPAGPEFSLKAAGALAWAAQLAYEVDTLGKLSRIMSGWGWGAPVTFHRALPGPLRSAEAKGFVTATNGATVIAFAGTEPDNIAEWQQNFDVWRNGNGVHQGFEDGVTAAWTDLADAAKQAKGGIYLTGHSLGGALAVVAAYRLVEAKLLTAEQILGIYTIGMPRVGDVDYAKAYNDLLGTRTFRLVHGEDLVTRVPPADVLGFHHVGRLLACTRAGSFAGAPAGMVDPAPMGDLAWLAIQLAVGLISDNDAPAYPAEEPSVVDDVRRLLPALRDHLTDCYLRALRAYPQS